MIRNINISVNDLGGELTSVIFDGRECLHQSDNIWKSQAPILFPTIGASFEDKILVDGMQYPQKHHGFARNVLFERAIDKYNKIMLYLSSSRLTEEFYPYNFWMNVSYKVNRSVLTVENTIINIEDKPIFFNFGYHPGFTLLEGTKLEDYYLEFEDYEENESIIKCTDPLPLFVNKRIHLKDSLFKEAAIVLKNLKSKTIYLLKDEERIFKFTFSSPFLGIWTRSETDKPFICLEPWYGLPDRKYSCEISNRPNVICLPEGKSYKFGYQVEFYK